MSTPGDVRRAITLTGLAFPRGTLRPEAAALADALVGGVSDQVALAGLLDRAARAHWPELRAPMEAALRRAPVPDDAADRAAIGTALELAASDDPANPLALALAQRAAAGLAAARRRSVDRLDSLAGAMAGAGSGDPGGDRAASAAMARAAGQIVVDLLDLDSEDFEPEIADYVAAGGTVDALRMLARATGDEEIRSWAREELAGLAVPAPPTALAAVRGMAQGGPPPDPAEDVVWVAAILALADEAVEIALADDDA